MSRVLHQQFRISPHYYTAFSIIFGYLFIMCKNFVLYRIFGIEFFWLLLIIMEICATLIMTPKQHDIESNIINISIYGGIGYEKKNFEHGIGAYYCGKPYYRLAVNSIGFIWGLYIWRFDVYYIKRAG